ncbi:UNVERIFIED_CONTAM: hypothetical protein FKN15_006380 [Acipenser sinensis]
MEELTERMDAVLLEKAETQQRLVLLRKENEKAKQEAKDALDKVTELQKQFDLSNVEHLKKIEDVKHELETVHSKHKEEAADLQKLLQESSKKEQMLTAQFRQQLGNQNEVKELEEQFKLVRQKYEDELSSLQQQLISSEEERRQETTMLKENQEAAIAECQKEIESLHGELLKIRTAHQEEVKELVDQLESAALEHEQERYRLLQMNEDLTEQLDQKENSLQDVEEEEETGIEWVKKHSEPLASGEQGEDEVINLKRMLKDLQSQHSILQDELTYLSNMKTELELELQQAKDEFLHEKEELEFNINELQLCKEDNDSIATKCKSDLQTTNDHWEMALNQHEQELQALKQRHQKEIVALEQTLLSAAEKEKGKALLEIQNLKEECEKLSVEKDEAVDSYEKTMEILRNVQSELGDTTGNFVKQYNAMKESNAAEIHELQQKLRAAFNEKDKLIERINNLESEAKSQQDTFEELKLSESDWENKKQELLSIQHHKDTALRELEEKLAALNLEKDDVLTALKHSEVEELTERMDAVLLEKAETQQRLVLLRKENEKAKQEAKDALDKVTELQKQFDLSNVEHLKKIEDVKHELETVHSKHKEEAADLQKLLQESSKKEQMLTAQFRQQLGNQNEVKELEEQFKLVRQKYEDQLSSLQQQLISSEEERRQETTMLKENQEAAIAECQKEIESLHGELLKIRTAHQEEVKELVDQLESAALEHEQERYRLLQVNEDLAEQLDQKENSLQDVEEEEETGIEWVKKHSEPLASGEQGEDEVINLKRMLKDLQSQHSILQDELTYLSNMKTELELELQQAKDEFLREKEELEFNINELQLCNEDNDSIATKCKSDLQTTNDHWEMALNQHEQELQVLKQRHQKEIVALEQTLLSAAEKEKGKALLEIQNLKEECEKLSVEKDEAVDSYEKTMEILRNVQSELGDTTGNFVKQYNAMKESNAAEIHELQQKLRVAFNEKDKLLERINNLESEAKSQQDTFEELKLSESDWENKKQELLSIQHHKDTALRELEEKLAALNLEKDDVLTALKHSEVEVKKLRDAFSTEQAQCDEFQQKLENLTKDKTQIKALEEELTNLKKERDNLQEELHLVRSDRDSLSKFKDEIGNLEKSSQAVSEEKEGLRNDFEEKLLQLTELQHRLEDLTKDKAQLHQRLDEAEMQLGTTFADKENITHQLKILESKLTVTCLEKEQKCSDLKALEEDLTSLKNERDHLQEELKLARSDSNNLYKLKGETGDLEKSLQAVSQEKERLRKDLEEKQQQLTDFQHRLEYLTKDNTQPQQRLDEAEIQMGANAAEKESISHQLEILENKVTALCLEKEQKCSDLKALEVDLTNLKKERDETGNLEKSLQAVSEEKERLRKDLEEKQQQLTDFQHRLEYLTKDNTQLQQRLDEAEIQMGANAAEKESISHQLEILENKVTALCLEKEQKCSDLKALEEDLTNLKKERDETGNLEKSLQAVSEEKERLGKDLEEKQQQVHVFNYLQQEAGIEVFANNDQEVEDISVLLQKLWDKVMEGKRSALLQSDERIAQLQDGIEKLREEGRLQEVELRSFNDDLSKERTLLKENLEEVLLDKEGLQRDLLEMKSRNENMRVENEALLAQIEAVSEKLKKIEKEKNDEIDQTVQQVVGDDEREKLLRLLAEKESELSNLQGEIASLQVQALKEELELVKTERESLSGSVKDVIQAAESYKKDKLISEKEDQLTCLETLQMNVKQLEAQIVELQKGKSAVEKELEGEKLLKEHKIKDHSTSLKEIEDLQRHLQKQNQQLQQAVQELEILRKSLTRVYLQDAQQSSLMDMEMADYERLVKELNQNISDKESRIEEYEGEIKIQKQRQETLQEEISSLKSCLDQTEDKNTKIKQLLVKTKKELADAKKSVSNRCTKLCGNQFRVCYFKSVVTFKMNLIPEATVLILFIGSKPARYSVIVERGTGGKPAATGRLQGPVPVQQTRKILHEQKNTDLPLFDLQSMAREEGEGMETTETESVSSGTHIPSLELLLNSPEPKMEPLVWQAEPTKEELAQELNTATKSIEHMNGLLHDTEATNAILMEQITLLKSEVRRLERNQEREKSVANLEYLKNVLLQFIFLKSGSERQALLPVIHTMLQLSPEERSKLSAIAQGKP